MDYLASIAKEFIFFSGDVQTTTIAMAITGSLCYSVLAAILQLLSRIYSQPISSKDDPAHEMTCTIQDGCSKYSAVNTDINEYVPGAEGIFELRQKLYTISHICLGEKFLDCEWTLGKGNRECIRKAQAVMNDAQFTKHSIGLQKNNHLYKSGNVNLTPLPLNVNLSYQKLGKWPSRLGYIGTHLRRLDLTGNQVTQLPDELGCLTGLHSLILAKNKLTTLPMSMCSLRDLKLLDISHNSFTTFPDCVNFLLKLKELVMTGNLLSILPSQLCKLKSLRSLNFNSNRLEGVPDELCGLKNLETLNLGKNPLSYLPLAMGDLIRLTYLNVSTCALTSLPASVTRCAALQVLQINNNRLTSLPVQMGRLHGLKVLNVEDNNISVFPSSLAGLPFIRIKAEGNPAFTQMKDWSSFTVIPCAEFPPLLELTARVVSHHQLPWKSVCLPKTLREMLVNERQCSTCEGPCYKYFASEITVQPVGVLDQWLPLLKTSCNPHVKTGCLFKR